MFFKFVNNYSTWLYMSTDQSEWAIQMFDDTVLFYHFFIAGFIFFMSEI